MVKKDSARECNAIARINCYDIVQMLQTYRVTFAFVAKEADQEPLRLERFEVGDLLVILSSEEGLTTFCRDSKSADLEGRSHFIIGNREFHRSTEQTKGRL